MQTVNDIYKVNEVVSKLSAFDISTGADYLLREDLGFDSLKLVELMIELEDTFDIRFGESELDPNNIRNLSDLYEMVGKRLY
ncbi:MAG: acyl carrier protein [Clostridiales bacterium]|jgi:acyl carrier protein|nr:acyl carrier protein [Clostridiales bacterium]